MWIPVSGNLEIHNYSENNEISDVKKESLYKTARVKSIKQIHHVPSTSRRHDDTDDEYEEKYIKNKETTKDILISELPNVIAEKKDEIFELEFAVCRKDIKLLITLILCINSNYNCEEKIHLYAW